MDPVSVLVMCLLAALSITYVVKTVSSWKSSSTTSSTTSSAASPSDETLEKIYQRCTRRGIKEWEGNAETIKKVVSSATENVSISEQEARRLFNQAIKRHVEIESERKAKKLKDARKKEREFVKQQRMISELSPKEKYSFGLNDIYDKLEDEHEALKRSFSTPSVPPIGMIDIKPKNPVASAALTGAFLGTAAGVTAGMKAQADNDRARQSYQPASDDDYFESRTRRMLEIKYILRDLDSVFSTLSLIAGRKIKEEKYDDYLNCSVRSARLSDTSRCLTVLLNIKPGTRTEHRIESEPAFAVDGTLKLTAYLDDEIIGEGVYCGGGLGLHTPVGFEFSKRFEMVYVPLNEKARSTIAEEGESGAFDVSKIQVEVSPIELWCTRKLEGYSIMHKELLDTVL
ncbi:hypothetical protein [Thermophilibacter provencensis]|uniref:Uncharacterized protein n=1 Tax=Thermophilibacter provencensis TaxID=1852386 RepID=A0A921KKM1_9ACTN|nr:hypothetical protein [Thermophilibacter provencensis]HJF44409.1 hypothetical protein [Thermophilibacter provencensis]